MSRKLLFKFFSICLLLSAFSTKLQANLFGGCWGNFSVDAEWLYFRPNVESTLLAQGLGTINSTNITFDHPYRSGWRVGARYYFCDCSDFLSIRWSQLRANDTRTYTSNIGFITPDPLGIAGPGSVPYRQKFNYYSFDGLAGHRMCSGACWFNWNLLYGVQYTWLGTKDTLNFTAPIGFRTTQVAHFWGVGPEVGLDFDVCICGGLAFVGRATGALLVSRNKHHIETSSPGNVTTFNTTVPTWKVVSTWDFRGGLKYTYCWPCVSVFVEAGYEVITYMRGLRSFRFFGSSIGFPSEFVNTDMHGLYVSAGVSF